MLKRIFELKFISMTCPSIEMSRSSISTFFKSEISEFHMKRRKQVSEGRPFICQMIFSLLASTTFYGKCLKIKTKLRPRSESGNEMDHTPPHTNLYKELFFLT